MSIVEMIFCILAGDFISLQSNVFKLFLMSLMKFFFDIVGLILKFFAAVDFHHV